MSTCTTLQGGRRKSKAHKKSHKKSHKKTAKRRTMKKRGGFIGSMLYNAAVPAALILANNRMGKKKRGKKSRKSRRKN